MKITDNIQLPPISRLTFRDVKIGEVFSWAQHSNDLTGSKHLKISDTRCFNINNNILCHDSVSDTCTYAQSNNRVIIYSVDLHLTGIRNT